MPQQVSRPGIEARQGARREGGLKLAPFLRNLPAQFSTVQLIRRLQIKSSSITRIFIFATSIPASWITFRGLFSQFHAIGMRVFVGKCGSHESSRTS
ncbi:hypothetical protein DM860_005740 [Cuscuta australis]|uniref:Uncharacterized protein n=1 Tax=Cuscuta australis TaxID=267555 RepID=A0A328DSD0_9ASTE|nr:hypothetical protein DM860_005740 [Cuscuta australis]